MKQCGPKLRPFSLFDAMRLVVAAFTALGLISLMMMLIKYPTRYVEVLITWAILPCVLLGGVFACLAPLMIPATRALRDERSLFGGCIRGLVVLHVAAQLLVMAIAFVGAVLDLARCN